jgi:hypothetical protein
MGWDVPRGFAFGRWNGISLGTSTSGDEIAGMSLGHVLHVLSSDRDIIIFLWGTPKGVRDTSGCPILHEVDRI